MDCELLEIHRRNYDEVSPIRNYSQLHNQINLNIIIFYIKYPVLILTGFSFVSYCIINVLIFKK